MSSEAKNDEVVVENVQSEDVTDKQQGAEQAQDSNTEGESESFIASLSRKWIYAGVGLLVAGVGTYIVLRSGSDESQEEEEDKVIVLKDRKSA